MMPGPRMMQTKRRGEGDLRFEADWQDETSACLFITTATTVLERFRNTLIHLSRYVSTIVALELMNL